MTIQWMDGFDTYAASADLYAQQYSGTGAVINTTAGRFGGGAVQLVNGAVLNANGVGAGLGAWALELWMGVALKMTSSSNNDNVICTFNSSAGVEGTLSYNSVMGVFKVWRGNLSNLVSQWSVAVTINAWHWLDVHYAYDNSNGTWEVWLDGAQVLFITSTDTTKNAGQTFLTSVSLGNQSDNVVNGYVDDWAIVDTAGANNNARIGDSRIETLKMTSDASPNNGTPSTGTDHFAVIDEDQWNSSDYLTMTNTSGQEELFGIAPLVSTPSAVYAVRPVMIAENTDAGTAYLQAIIVSAGVNAGGDDLLSLSSDWQRFGSFFELDPNTAAPFLYADVNALQVGFEVP